MFIFNLALGGSEKLHSLTKLWLERWLVGLWQCVQCGWGFFLFFCGGEKKTK